MIWYYLKSSKRMCQFWCLIWINAVCHLQVCSEGNPTEESRPRFPFLWCKHEKPRYHCNYVWHPRSPTTPPSGNAVSFMSIQVESTINICAKLFLADAVIIPTLTLRQVKCQDVRDFHPLDLICWVQKLFPQTVASTSGVASGTFKPPVLYEEVSTGQSWLVWALNIVGALSGSQRAQCWKMFSTVEFHLWTEPPGHRGDWTLPLSIVFH